MSEEPKIIWMPHPGHFICADHCRFILNAYVNGFIVSTVGEYVPDSQVRKIFRESRGRETDLRGDAEEVEFGFEEIGGNRLYETMVFKAIKSEYTCCPYRMESGSEIDAQGYNEADLAYKGHMDLMEKYKNWGNK